MSARASVTVGSNRALLLVGHAPVSLGGDGDGGPDGLVGLGGDGGAVAVPPAGGRGAVTEPSPMLAVLSALLDERGRIITAAASRTKTPQSATVEPRRPAPTRHSARSRAEAFADTPLEAPPRPPPRSRWNEINESVRGDRVVGRVQSGGLSEAPCSLLATGDAVPPRLVFHSQAYPMEAWRVRSLRGRSAVSELYAFDLEIEARFSEAMDPVTMDALLGAPAKIAYGPEAERPTHGIVSEVELLTDQADEVAVYRVTLVPRLWLLTQTRRSRVFADMNVPAVLRAVLRAAGLDDPSAPLFDIPRHWDRDLARFPKHEYVVQYDETDFDFFCRLAAHDGVFFFFVQGEAVDRVEFAIDGLGTPRFSDDPLPFQPDQGRLFDREPVISFRGARRRLPRQVAVNEYNWRHPDLPLAVSAPVSPTGFGTVVLYGEHYKSEAEGLAIARVRAAELAASARVYRGRSRVRGLAAGHRFKLEGHFDTSADLEYLVLEIVHTGRDGGTPRADDAEEPDADAYVNEFVAVPSDQPYAPPQRVPWPRIDGLVHGRVSGVENGMSAPLDDQGRYKVDLPWAEAENPGEAVSRWMRRAQLSAGADYGTHVPLHVGAEVLIAHVEGDPDRPVILAALHNGAQASPVTSANASASIIKTRGAIRIVMSDG